MVIMGFDPGSIRFGVAVLKKENSTISYIYSEVIKLPDADFNLRMKTLWHRLIELYDQFKPEAAAVEEGFLGKNVKSMNILAKVRGVVLASLIQRDLELTSYSPRLIKQALTGSGSATKQQVAKMVSTLLNIKSKTTGTDESDAMAVAYTHLLHLKRAVKMQVSNPSNGVVK